MRVLYINSVCGFGSTGRIVADLARMNDSLVCYGRKKNYAEDIDAVKITSLFGNILSAFETIFFDKTGFTNTLATRKLIREIKKFNPDIIHIHNMHGYYMNIKVLFEYLSKVNIPVVMTLHDCFNFTGYCPYYDFSACDKFKSECKDCPMSFAYPYSLFKQNTKENFHLKKTLLNVFKYTIVTPSKWLANELESSFLASQDIRVINNGIDLNKFYPKIKKNEQLTIIYVANVITDKKGKKELMNLLPLLNQDIRVIIVGKSDTDFSEFPSVEYHPYIEDVEELANLYSQSHFLINLTLEDNYPTVNIEALACGTPVITYKTGGSPEIIDDNTGIVFEKHDVTGMADYLNHSLGSYDFDISSCLERAEQFTKEVMCYRYDELYKEILNRK